MKKKIVLSAVFIIVIAGIAVNVDTSDQVTHTTFQEIVLDNIEDNYDVALVLRRYSDDRTKEARVAIKDTTMARHVLDSFSTMQLKRVKDAPYDDDFYNVRLEINRSIEFDIEINRDRKFVHIYNRKNRMKSYEITNHFDPILVIEERALDWEKLHGD